jgi:excisionase family DNA binding protein
MNRSNQNYFRTPYQGKPEANIKSFSQNIDEQAGQFVTELLAGILDLFLTERSQDSSMPKIVTQGSEKLLTGSEVANRLDISKAKAYKLMSTGRIVSIRFDKTIRVREQDLAKFINDHIIQTM